MGEHEYLFHRFGGYDWPTCLEPAKPISKKRVLTGKEIAKRKVKRDMAKKSRKANRK